MDCVYLGSALILLECLRLQVFTWLFTDCQQAEGSTSMFLHLTSGFRSRWAQYLADGPQILIWNTIKIMILIPW